MVTGAEQMRELIKLVPTTLLVLLLTLIAASPWGIGAHTRFLLPLLPLLAIVHLTLRRPEAMPAGLVFVGGLLLDVLTHGPLGYWPLVFLAGHLAALNLSQRARETLPRRTMWVAAVMAVVVLVEWLVSSVYFMQLAAWQPITGAALAAIVAYPILALILDSFSPHERGRRPLQLERRG